MAVIAETPRNIDLDSTISKIRSSNIRSSSYRFEILLEWLVTQPMYNDPFMFESYHDRFQDRKGSASKNQIKSRSRSDQLNSEIFKRATVISQKLTEELWEQDFKLILLKRT